MKYHVYLEPAAVCNFIGVVIIGRYNQSSISFIIRGKN